MLIKNLLDFSRSRDQRLPGSLLPKRKDPGDEVAQARVDLLPALRAEVNLVPRAIVVWVRDCAEVKDPGLRAMRGWEMACTGMTNSRNCGTCGIYAFFKQFRTNTARKDLERGFQDRAVIRGVRDGPLEK